MFEGTLTILRPLEGTDLERVYKWINDREVTRNLAARYPLSRKDEVNWLENGPSNSYETGVRMAIETKDGVHIGNLDLSEVKPEDRKAQLGVMIGEKDYWGAGYGTDAILTLLRFGFYDMNLNRIWLHVFEDNARAYACYLKCGFQEEGRLRQHYYAEGRYWDSIVMAILRHEYDALHVAAEKAEGAGV